MRKNYHLIFRESSDQDTHIDCEIPFMHTQTHIQTNTSNNTSTQIQTIQRYTIQNGISFTFASVIVNKHIASYTD